MPEGKGKGSYQDPQLVVAQRGRDGHFTKLNVTARAVISLAQLPGHALLFLWVAQTIKLGGFSNMAYRNRAFVSFDGDNDIHYYRLMKAWKQNDNTPFHFSDAHELQQARDSSLETTIKSSLQERLRNSKTFVILIGESTRFLFKFVRWEMEQAIRLELPIIAVNLNGLRYRDDVRCPPIIRDQLAVHISFNSRIMQKALEEWPGLHQTFMEQNRLGPFYYKDEVYRELGL